MILRERRRNFLINKPLQLRYLATLTVIVLIILFVSLGSAYLGIWGGVLDAFSDERIQNDLLTASRLQQYEEARYPRMPDTGFSTLSFFAQAERLSNRQREVFREILNETNGKLAGKLFLLLIFLAAGTLFISHKIAGPLYRFQNILDQMAQGDLQVRCHLRKFDEAKLVAQTFNKALESLDGRVSRLKQIIRENEKHPDCLLPLLKEALSHFKTSADR